MVGVAARFGYAHPMADLQTSSTESGAREGRVCGARFQRRRLGPVLRSPTTLPRDRRSQVNEPLRASPKDRFRKAEGQGLWILVPCRLCGAPAELWQRWSHDDVWDSFGACTNLEDVDGEACVFHLPDSVHFYRQRKFDAVRYWNLIMGPRSALAEEGSGIEPPSLAELREEADYVEANNYAVERWSNGVFFDEAPSGEGTEVPEEAVAVKIAELFRTFF